MRVVARRAASCASASSSRSPRAPGRRARSGPPRSGSTGRCRPGARDRRPSDRGEARAPRGRCDQASRAPAAYATRVTSRVSPGAHRIESPGRHVEPEPARRVAIERERAGSPARTGSGSTPAPVARPCSSRRAVATFAVRARSGTSPSPNRTAPGLPPGWSERLAEHHEPRALVEQHLDTDLGHQVRHAVEHRSGASAAPPSGRPPPR